MSKVTIDLIQQLRDKTGVGMMDCKQALNESGGDLEKAIDILRRKGAKVAAKRAGQETKNGLVHAYIHPGSRVGVMVEIACETDFSANTDTLRNFAHDVCMQIAANSPLAVGPDDLDPTIIAKEREIIIDQLRQQGKPDGVIEKIVEGKIKKYYETVCLMDQPFIKNDKITLRGHLNEIVAKINENIRVSKFVRFQIGG